MKINIVSMPSSGLIHFYQEIGSENNLRAFVSMPSSGLIHFYLNKIFERRT